ncbi:MAG TPA: hypothetical protein VMI31_07875 [Fimbriimonadaceae bacterium]|nr:hypothetical protein [Fimbriimonadaceae bacterium]
MQPTKPINGALILTLGILSWVGFGILTGIPAWVLGNSALDRINAGDGDPSQADMATIGRFLGMLMTGIYIGAFVVGIGVIAVGLATQR